jgi:hypothetical protein
MFRASLCLSSGEQYYKIACGVSLQYGEKKRKVLCRSDLINCDRSSFLCVCMSMVCGLAGI